MGFGCKDWSARAVDLLPALLWKLLNVNADIHEIGSGGSEGAACSIHAASGRDQDEELPP